MIFKRKPSILLFSILLLFEIESIAAKIIRDKHLTNMFEGDIALTKGEFKKIENDVRNSGGTRIRGTWKDGIVPYIISTEFSSYSIRVHRFNYLV